GRAGAARAGRPRPAARQPPLLAGPQVRRAGALPRTQRQRARERRLTAPRPRQANSPGGGPAPMLSSWPPPHPAPPPPSPPPTRRAQPGGGFVMSLDFPWARLRRACLRLFRPGYVRHMVAVRQGHCDGGFDVIDGRDLKFIRPVCGWYFQPEDDRFAWRGRLG